jgi:hypothetical protein
MKRLRWIGAVVGSTLGFMLAAQSASAIVHTYYGPEWTAYYLEFNDSAWNYPDSHRVYRPAGYYFTIYYRHTDGTASGYKRNYWDNPLVWPSGGGYAQSVCAHTDHDFPGPQYNVTCQYTT